MFFLLCGSLPDTGVLKTLYSKHLIKTHSKPQRGARLRRLRACVSNVRATVLWRCAEASDIFKMKFVLSISWLISK